MRLCSKLQVRQPENPLISVVLPTFNRCRLLGRALDSVLAQTYRNLELIVVDDGSTDDTALLLSAYARDRLRVIRQPNRGVSAARNAGMRQASGQWIALLDSDDYWLPQKLERQLDFFKNNPTQVICQTEEIWIRNGVRVNPKKRHQKFSGWIFEKCLPLCLISPSAVMLRASLLEQVGFFDENLPACEDYDLWLRVTSRYPVGLIKEPLIVKCGGHADQLSRRPELDKYRIQALGKILDRGGLSPAQQAAARAVLVEKCLIYAGGCRKRGRLQEALHYEALAGFKGNRPTSTARRPACDIGDSNRT
jgi:glycosyltransferase involved in cell wall biosynthesis